MTTKFLGFDHDFAFGEAGENFVKNLLTGGKKVEVKTDRIWKKTGNLYIEHRCWQNLSQTWQDSGIKTTEADYWAFVVQQSILIFPTGVVKNACKNPIGELPGGDFTNPSEGYLITVEQLLEENKKWSHISNLK